MLFLRPHVVSVSSPCCPPTEGRAGGLVYGYGDDDLNRTEEIDNKLSGDEDSRESNSVSILRLKPQKITPLYWLPFKCVM